VVTRPPPCPPRARSDLTVDLDFRDDGTIAGRVDTDASLLWPQPLALTGTWTAAGAVTIEMRERLPAEGWRHSPIARDLGRVLLMTGTRTAAGLEGSVTHTITGMRAAPVMTQGAFMLRRQGPLTGIVHAPDFTPKDATAPTWLAPPDLDAEACDGLGDLYGADPTLPAPSAACDACAVGVCSADDMVACGADLRSASYNLEPVLAALHGDGEVKPPSGQWTWDDCAADEPAYSDGLACRHRRASLRRRAGARQEHPDARRVGEALAGLAAVFAADEALAADLLATEAQIAAAFAFKDKIGEPNPDAFARELAFLATDRERIAAALAPTLTPAYTADRRRGGAVRPRGRPRAQPERGDRRRTGSHLPGQGQLRRAALDGPASQGHGRVRSRSCGRHMFGSG